MTGNGGGRPSNDEPTVVQGCEVLREKGAVVFVKYRDGEEYSVPKSQLCDGSISRPGEAGALVVPKWLVEKSLVPGTDSHQPTWRAKRRAEREQEERDRTGKQRTFSDEELDADLDRAGLGKGGPPGGAPSTDLAPGRQPYGEPPKGGTGVSPPPPAKDAQAVSEMALRRVKASERNARALERLGDAVLCFGIAWLARNDTTEDGIKLRRLAHERLRKMMGAV